MRKVRGIICEKCESATKLVNETFLQKQNFSLHLTSMENYPATALGKTKIAQDELVSLQHRSEVLESNPKDWTLLLRNGR